MCQIWPIKHSCLACSLFPEESRNSCSRSKCHPDGSATLTNNPAEMNDGCWGCSLCQRDTAPHSLTAAALGLAGSRPIPSSPREAGSISRGLLKRGPGGALIMCGETCGQNSILSSYPVREVMRPACGTEDTCAYSLGLAMENTGAFLALSVH